MRILMVLTSHELLGDSGKKTGLWLDEFTAPYYVFKDAGAQVTLASPKGGRPPIDPQSEKPRAQTETTKRFQDDGAAQQAFADTLKLASVHAADYDAVFYPGGHGPVWDLADDRDSIALIETMHAAGKPLALLCHGPAALRHAKAADGSPLVNSKRVAALSNTEEAAVGLAQVVPFLVEDMLKGSGGLYSRAADWLPHVVSDGNLITGQNPASAQGAARALLEQLEQAKGRRAA